MMMENVEADVKNDASSHDDDNDAFVEDDVDVAVDADVDAETDDDDK